MKAIGQLVVKALAVLIVSRLLPGFRIDSLGSAVVAAAAIAVADLVIRPVLQFLALPLTVLTLGLFSLVVNGVSLYLASQFVPGFVIDSIFTSIVAAIVLSLVSAVLRIFIGK